VASVSLDLPPPCKAPVEGPAVPETTPGRVILPGFPNVANFCWNNFGDRIRDPGRTIRRAWGIPPILPPMSGPSTPPPNRWMAGCPAENGTVISESGAIWPGQARPRPFHLADPWGEKAHTSLRAQGFAAASDGTSASRWAAQQQWTFAELGTGTGCALACLLAAFQRHATSTQRLQYVGFERDPSMLDWWRDPASQERIPDPERIALQAMLSRPIRPTHGMTRWRLLDGRATVTLVLGDAAQWLPQVGLQADAWFLDAYEPAIEKHLWSMEVIGHVARLTKPGGTASTFSAAASVRAVLHEAGFQVARVPGFDTKRHMTVATRREHQPDRFTAPWFAPPRPAHPQTVTVLGAGLAGAWCARAFAERGARVTVVEPARGATRASDVPLAAAAEPDGSWQSEQVRVHDAAWHLLADRCIDLGLPHRRLPIVTTKGPTARTAIVAAPQELTKALLDHALIRLTSCAPSDEFVVHATGLATAALDGTVCARARPLPNGGSVGLVPLSFALASSVMDDGYALPCLDGSHAWIGGTNHPGITAPDAHADPSHPMHADAEARALDAMTARLLKAHHPLIARWSGTRAASLDHLPMIGPIADDEAFTGAYRAIKHGPAAQDWPACPYLSGQWCSIGHGSHGMITAPLAADLIADLAYGTPRVITNELLPFLMPQRFALRALKRGSV